MSNEPSVNCVENSVDSNVIKGIQTIINGDSEEAQKIIQEMLGKYESKDVANVNVSNSVIEEGGQQVISVNNTNSTNNSYVNTSGSVIGKGAKQTVSANGGIADASGSILGEGAHQFVGVGNSEDIERIMKKFGVF